MVCQEIPDYFPIPTIASASTPRPYSIIDFLGTPEEAPATPEPVSPRPTSIPPKPAPTYDSTPISSDLDGDNCRYSNGCLRFICHYEQFSPYAYHEAVGPREEAAHMAQHPNDYPDGQWETDPQECKELPRPKDQDDEDEDE